jgi:DNA-binding CsgD family transcriptional regulator
MAFERGVPHLLSQLRRLARSRRAPPRTGEAAALIGRLLAGAAVEAAAEQAGGCMFRLRITDGGDVCLLTVHVRDASDTSDLTASERDVADRLCEGLTLAQIARLRGVTINTVKSQVRQVFRKLDVESRVALVRRLCP